MFEKSRNNRKILLENGPIKAVLNPKSCLLAEMKESRLDIAEMLYADDYQAGYPGLGENALICTWNTAIEQAEEEIRVESSLFPANGLTPATFSGTIRNIREGRVFEGEIRFSGESQFRAVITADLDSQPIGETPANVIDLDSAGEDALKNPTEAFSTTAIKYVRAHCPLTMRKSLL